MKKLWTVIALWDSDGFVTTSKIKATDPHEAMARFADSLLSDDRNYVQVIGAVACGRGELVRPCEDASKAAYAVDLATKGDSAA